MKTTHPLLTKEMPWRIGVCLGAGESAGSAIVIRLGGGDGRYYFVELSKPTPVPGGSPDDTFVLAPESQDLFELLEVLQPQWLPVGDMSEMAYRRHFPNGLSFEEL